MVRAGYKFRRVISVAAAGWQGIKRVPNLVERKLRTPFLINEWGVKSMLQRPEKKTGT